MQYCPKGTPIVCCRNREVYETNDPKVNDIIYQEKFCVACELIGPLKTEECCYICGELNDEKNIIDKDSLKQLDSNFDPLKYHSFCYAMANLNLSD